MWTSREGWLSAVRTWAQSPGFAAARASAGVSITAATLLAIAAVMAEHADHATGRHVAVTRATIAARVGCDVRTVTAAWRLLRTARWAVEAQRGHGSPGTPSVGRRPSVYHLVPRRTPQPVHVFHLPPSLRDRRLSHAHKNSPNTPERAEKISASSKKRQPRNDTPRPLAVQRLAADLVARSHGLDRGHIGNVCDALTAAGIDPAVWSARAITDVLNRDMRERGWSWPDRIERPAAFLSSRLRRLDWRPQGGGTAAAGLDENDGAVAPTYAPAPRVVLTEAQRRRRRQQLDDALTDARRRRAAKAASAGNHRAPVALTEDHRQQRQRRRAPLDDAIAEVRRRGAEKAGGGS